MLVLGQAPSLSHGIIELKDLQNKSELIVRWEVTDLLKRLNIYWDVI
jgi:hypothetical protein